MKINSPNDKNVILRWALKGLKYFLLTLLGFAIASVVSHVFGAFLLARMLLSPSLWMWFLRIAVFLFCLFAIAMMFESWG